MAFCIVCGAKTETDAPLCDPWEGGCEDRLASMRQGERLLPVSHREHYKRGWDAAQKARIARERREERWRLDFERLLESGGIS